MLSTARSIFLMFGFLLLAGPVAAQQIDVGAAFLKCDGLIGKSTGAVAAALGAPFQTAAYMPPNRLTGTKSENRAIGWNYNGDNHTFLYLVFIDKKLAGANLQGPGHTKAYPDFMKGFAALVKNCKQPSSKYIFFRMATTEDYTAQIDATTANGNRLLTAITGDTEKESAPFTFSHVFNSSTGLFKDTYPQNPHFSVKDPPAEINEVYLTSNSPAVMKFDIWPGLQNYIGPVDRKNIKYVGIPILPSNSPWIYGGQ